MELHDDTDTRSIVYRDTLDGPSVILLDLQSSFHSSVTDYINRILKSARWIASDPLIPEIEPEVDPNAFHFPKPRSRRNSTKSKKPPPESSEVVCTLSPITPFVYHGEADLAKFTMWMTQVYVYIHDNHVPERRRVFIAARFCGGNALRYFTIRVLSGTDSDQWTLSTFFEGIFKSCFPPNYFEDMKMKFHDRTQGERSVTEFAIEMKEMAEILSEEVDETLLSYKFWHGLHPSIRKELTTQGHHSETDHFQNLVWEAKTVERIAQLRKVGATEESLSASLRAWKKKEETRLERERIEGVSGDDGRQSVHRTGYAVVDRRGPVHVIM